MRLSQVIELLGNNVSEVSNLDGVDLELTSIESDSRLLKPGNMFICICGHSFDSHILAKDAVEAGASAIIAERPLPNEEGFPVPVVYVKDSRLAESILTMEFYANPYRELTAIGVTGTNGKTTITTLIYHVLNVFESSPALIGTIRNVIGDKIIVNPENTTPGPSTLARYLKLALEKQCRYFVMEVSSHALSMHRVDGMRFDVALLNNVTRDHLDFHQSFEEYYKTKLKIFQRLKGSGMAVVNADQINLGDVRVPRNRVFTYGFGDESDYRIEDLEISRTGMEFLIHTPNDTVSRVYTRLLGEHNAYNVAAAIAVLNALNYDMEHIAEAISTFSGVPGRYEFVEESTKYGFDVVVDFAHTPDALEKLLKTAISLATGRVILVFGAGGSADRGKRPMMAEVASRFASVVILTSDDPKQEDPREILEDLELGMNKFKPYLLIADRHEAISVALTLANREDTVIIAGRGHEDFQIMSDRKIQFNDKQVVKEILETKFRRHVKK